MGYEDKAAAAAKPHRTYYLLHITSQKSRIKLYLK